MNRIRGAKSRCGRKGGGGGGGKKSKSSSPTKVLRRRCCANSRRSNSIGCFGSVASPACLAASICLFERFCSQQRLSPTKHSSAVTALLADDDDQEFGANRRLLAKSPICDPPGRVTHIRGADRWSFNIFVLSRFSCDQLVCPLGLHLFDQHDLFRRLKLSRSLVCETLSAIEASYWSQNPYHNALHASDVAQATHCFVSQSRILDQLTAPELLACLLAAFCHDAGHPGVNQSHYRQTGHFLVQLYDTSVLENHHVRITLSILDRTGLLDHLDPKDWQTVRSYLTSIILSTDITFQDRYRQKFAEFAASQPTSSVPQYDPSQRLLILQFLLKCADISNPCRPWKLCRRWARRVVNEFFFQGDQERNRYGLNPIPPMDRRSATVSNIQIGFVDNLVQPLFNQLDSFFQTDLTRELLANLETNRANWGALTTQHETTGPACITTTSKLKAGKPHGVPTGSHNNHQTFVIRTCPNLRRHSLPETLRAIRSTFTYCAAKRSHPLIVLVPRRVYRRNQQKTSKSATELLLLEPARTDTVNILQTLCEEIRCTLLQQDRRRNISTQLNDSSSSSSSSRGQVAPFPLPNAWSASPPFQNRYRIGETTVCFPVDRMLSGQDASESGNASRLLSTAVSQRRRCSEPLLLHSSSSTHCDDHIAGPQQQPEGDRA